MKRLAITLSLIGYALFGCQAAFGADLWTVQAYHLQAQESQSEAGTATAARKLMLDACSAMAGKAGLPAPTLSASLRALASEADSTYFPCDLVIDGFGHRSTYVRVVVVKQ